jgi:hypothetical protein
MLNQHLSIKPSIRTKILDEAKKDFPYRPNYYPTSYSKALKKWFEKWFGAP